MKEVVNILGTEYVIETHKVSEDKYLEENNLGGYCCEYEKLIVIADVTDKEHFPYMTEKEQGAYRKNVLRHELVHAFLNESGLSDSASVPGRSWAKNEEMVDWIAIQSPKIFEVFRELDIM